MELLINFLVIFFVRIIDVSLGTLSTVLVIRGRKGLGSIIGFIDVTIWFLIVRQALSIDNASIWIAIAYASGYAIGTYAGSWVEEKLALGNSSLTVITKGIRYDLVDVIREKGFAVSTIKFEGKDKENLMLLIQINRKKINYISKIIREVAPDSFITISDTKQIINGYFR
ncbi:MAG: DUF5698 domain-containing protein [Bacilli bacterium]|jgi:uncharacterized protein YebE (UPF0316 family)